MDELTRRTLAALDDAYERMMDRGVYLNFNAHRQTDFHRKYIRAIVAAVAAEYMLDLSGYRPPERDPEHERIVRQLMIEGNSFASQLGRSQFVRMW